MNITLNNGREIRLYSIYQDKTYGGLLCGVPNEKINNRIIKNNMKYILDKMDAKSAYLVPPPSITVKNHETTFEEYIRIPYITCFARFESSSIKDDTENHASSLTIVWYQDNFAMPIDDFKIRIAGCH